MLLQPRISQDETMLTTPSVTRRPAHLAPAYQPQSRTGSLQTRQESQSVQKPHRQWSLLPATTFEIENVPANMIYPDPGAPPPPPRGDPYAGLSDGTMSGGDYINRRSGNKSVLRVPMLG